MTNTLFSRKDGTDGSGGTPQAREVVSLRLSQKYYFDPTFGGALQPGKQIVFDPTLSLTGFAFAQGRRLSPLVSVLKVAPFSNFDHAGPLTELVLACSMRVLRHTFATA